MRNNKGFATTFILFSLLLVFLIIMSVLMATLNNSSTLTSNLRNRLTDDVESPNIYKEYNFAATGDVQVFTAPASKIYTVEGWSISGKYLKTTKSLKKNEQLYLYIGKNGSSFNNGKTDVRTVYLTSDNSAESIASIILDVDTNGVTNGKVKPIAGSDGYVKIKYSSLQAKNIGYNNGNTHINCSNVQCAIDKVNKKLKNNSKLCVRATQEQLHQYGQVGTKGELHSGDAFICDVNGDEIYNDKKELFYYVSDYFDTNTKSFNSDYAALIYYSNVSGASADNTAKTKYHEYVPVSGPSTAKELLPTSTQWENVTLYKETRAILGEYKGTHNSSTFDSSPLPTNFSYSGYAARLLTAQELIRGCGLQSGVGNFTANELANCNYLVEGIVTSPGQSVLGYWLETPSASLINNRYYIWVVIGYDRYINGYYNSDSYGVRPVIDVRKAEMDY